MDAFIVFNHKSSRIVSNIVIPDNLTYNLSNNIENLPVLLSYRYVVDVLIVFNNKSSMVR